MSYWGGAWSEGEGDNPMRYAGGMLGGTWLASLTADLGDGKFDGAYLVQNFENLNPANTLWDKYYHVFANVDTEPPRFLEFERWWGGFYLMNREEIEWITRNLFVGNKLWSGDVKSARAASAFDLREIRSPIILFASMGDNITPPQQAFNWVADVYGSTEEIKARGQVIVGLLHQDIGHLGIFVSGKVAKKEHAQIVSVLKSIEGLPPGLYGMEITEHKGADGKRRYEVEFHERRLEDIVARLNRFERADEKPFEAVAAVSDFNQRAYELFARPLVQAMSNEYTAKMLRELPSAALPALGRLAPQSVALVARAGRGGGARRTGRPLDDGPSAAPAETAGAELVSASLDYYRAVRDAISEASFFPSTATCSRCTRGEQATRSAGAGDGRRARAAGRARRRWPRSSRAATPRRSRASPSCWRARASRCRCRGWSCAQELVDDYADCLPADVAGRGAPHPRRAGNHRALRARARDRRRCRCCSPSTPTASAC